MVSLEEFLLTNWKALSTTRNSAPWNRINSEDEEMSPLNPIIFYFKPCQNYLETVLHA